MSIEEAAKHAAICTNLLDSDKLTEALTYCTVHGIDPPQCSLTADSQNARNLRIKAMEHLSDEAWWRKRLAIKAKRDAEAERINHLLLAMKSDEVE